MIRKICILSVLILSMASCTKDFNKINVDPTQPASVPLDYIFGQSQLLFAGSAGDPGYTTWRGNFIYAMPMVQQFASLGSFYSGDKYLFSATNDASGAYFGTSNGAGNYPNSIKNLVNLIYLARQDSVTNVNILSMARIIKVLQMSIMTDLYGDIPYFQAGLGYLSAVYSPAYDKQQDIYMDMLNELDQAGSALSASAYIPSAADFAYQGDIAKWKHFANSLMLRLAMRLQKVDPATAQAWASKALTAGVMTSNDESYIIIYPGGASATTNPNSYNLGPSNKLTRGEVLHGNIQWSKTLIDAMKARQDPRLSQIAAVGETSAGTGTTPGDNSPGVQKGLPNGLDASPDPIATYSVMNINIYTDNAPDIILSYAEVEFLKAEAIERGWFAGSAATEYQNGQAAALQQMASFLPAYAPTPGAITAYQAANPYPAGTLDNKVEAIQTELWVLFACTFNGYEAWADWRRTGFPVLTPVNYVGNASGGQIPRRLIYPTEQITLSADAYKAVVAAQGADVFTTRMWWDTP
ncbi:MAG: SusD/RagB family nutrient-binding outer membrane lipoprotein [Puia sp.]